MPRKPAIILLVLLLIGGGAVAFHFHLRAQEPPPFSEVDDFLIHPPDSFGWLSKFPDQRPAEDMVRSVPTLGWLRRFGINSSKEVTSKTYWFTPSREPGSRWVTVIVDHDAQGIESVIVGGLPADAADFTLTLGEKFPRLRRLFKTIS